MMELDGPVGGAILEVVATVSLEQVAAATRLTSKTRDLNELNGKTVELETTPSIYLRTLRLDVPPTGAFRFVP